MTQEIQNVIDRAVASGRQVTVVVIGGELTAAMLGTEPTATTVEINGEQPGGDPARWTPLERLHAAMAKHGRGARKESDWADDVCGSNDLSRRELERACKHGAVTWTRKDDGRDSGAREIEGVALEAYLELREEVRQRRKTPPEWWSRVVPERHRRVI